MDYMISSMKIAKKLAGRRIVDVICDYGPDKNTTTSLEVDGNECYIILDNGEVIKCWNSEWGGIELGTITKADMIVFQEAK